MAQIKLIHTGGPFGDATDNYDVETDAKTIGEFIDIASKKDNFTTFNIRGQEYSKHRVCVAYAVKGTIERQAKDFSIYANCKIKNIIANGGWGAMTYEIEIEDYDSIPEQSKDDFALTYWGYLFTKK